ncbi:L-threonylcarbamoyladenylate synthase [Salisediminibacterium halotolerans]|uniref:L-threonylcarbamoyladenylate synthase n=1 Tax=Salisediminibacterium halotolerans TaxID=517425 RepID=UPI000EB07AAA|nr:L-threonylcarbamoyladenylate synthase [Salisediminibacterium halotolerans]RLJ75812.1 translation factor SUA5 [Actinophytocola xinjiangensis]RPE89666.1 translation factor SUA5 [Salisediminibacterium halotolerans]TWG36425.1 translation factor SUA5 [Salisediminibacterium halotolerans]GEL08389.1 threonylcarbamoyl-AMP synthase [Salisediminibacterium halotolerans]
MQGYKTVLRQVDTSVDNLVDDPAVEEAAQLLKSGEVVAFPTETVYGLGGDATLDEAIARIYEAKGRPSDNPLIVHIAGIEQAKRYADDIPPGAEQLMNAFWPGPLTIVLRHNGSLSPKVTAGLDTVGMRMPADPAALALITAADLPLAAPSANRSGRPSPTSARHVYDDLNGRIPVVLDGGETGVGVESTVVDATQTPVMILRPGGISKEELEAVVGPVAVDPSLAFDQSAKPKSPGMKYAHYAPDAPLVLVDGDAAFLAAVVHDAKAAGKRAGALVFEEQIGTTGAEQEVSLGPQADPAEAARRLYDALRVFKRSEVDIIYAVTFADSGIGGAVMNRLLKAAGGRRVSAEDSN